MTNPPSPPRELGPARFQRRTAARQERHVMRSLGAALVLLALVGGLPALLFWLDGLPPVPTSLPTREDLTSEIGPDQLVTVLVAVAWLAWLQFTLCVIVEFRSALSGIGLPSRVPLSGPSQRFARALVGSVLLAATAAGPATAAAPVVTDGPALSPAVTASAVAEDAASAAPTGPSTSVEVTVNTGPANTGPAPAPDGDATYLLGDIVLTEAEGGAELHGHKVYRVQPPQGRYHDNLWDIAERHLGDGRRYKEIFELNKGRTQPDGHELSLARLIYPNWLLIMPDDASGLDRVTAVSSGSGAGADGAEPTDAQPSAGDGAADASAGDATSSPLSFDLSGIGGSLDGGLTVDVDGGGGLAEVGERSTMPGRPAPLIAAGLLAAGLLAAIETARRRRRTPQPDDDAVEAEVALRIGADPQRASRLDAALRVLAAGCQDRQAALPPVYAAVVDDTGVEILLSPPVANAPEPWHVLDEGRRWRLNGRPSARGDAPAPFPGLVSLGRDTEDRDVLIDLEAAGGPVAIVGDPTAGYEVATAIAAELATNRWSDHLRVTGAGLPYELSAFDPVRFTYTDDLAPVLAEMAAKRADQVGADVLTGRVRWAGADAFVPEYVVLGTTPSEQAASELLAVSSSHQRSPLGVVCAGEFPGARWRIEVDAAGNVELPALGLSAAANRLSQPTTASIAALIAPPEPVMDGTPGTVATLHESWLPDARPQVASPLFEADTSRLATAPVRVFVLGPPEVQAEGEIDDDRRELATEIVVHLALHREGVHPTVLASAVWPRGVTGEVREAAIERVRAWLGADPEGSPYLRTAPDGSLRLSSDVVVDWEVVQTLLARSREATPEEERDLLRRALRVARGPALSERPKGRYSWLARARLERAASDLLVDASHRLAMLCLDAGDGATAAAAAKAGIRVRPGEQLLWRDLLRIEYARGGREAVLAVTDNLTAELGSLGVAELEPETMALLEELLPNQGEWPGAVAGGQVQHG